MKCKKILVKSLSAVTMLGIVSLGFLSLEPSVRAASVSDDITVTQGVTTELTISSPSDVTLSPTIAGMTGGKGTGSATWTVTTNNLAGFAMSIKASTDPALKSAQGNSFADYTQAGTVPDFTWDVAAADSEFGYTVEPHTVEDTVQAFKDDGSVCGGTGTANAADKCWKGLTTSDFTVISRSHETPQAGEAETVKFEAESGSSHYQVQGSYSAVVTVTAVTL